MEPLPFAETLRRHHERRRLELSPAYERTARDLVELHLVPHFGERDLRELRRSDVHQFAAERLERGFSVSVIAGAISIARRCCNALREEGTLERNPFERPGRLLSGLRRRTAHEVERAPAFTTADLGELLKAAGRHRRFAWFRPLLVFLVGTGARRGEAIALRWSDVDLGRGVVVIRRSSVRGRESVPKSGRARTVPLDAASPVLRDELERLACERAPAPRDHVFLSPRGRPIGERNLLRTWYALLGRAHVPPLRLHDLRHTFASHAIEAGVSIPRVSAWLGHAQLETTLRVYAHVLPPEREQPRGFLALTPTEDA